MKRIIKQSNILSHSDKKWPKPDKIGKQELNIRLGTTDITYRTSKIGSAA